MKAVFQLTAVLALLGEASSFLNKGPVAHPVRSRAVDATIMMGGRKATPLGRVSTRAGKEAKVAAMKEHLERSMLIFAIPGAGLTYPQVSALREKMPESTTVSVCKNTLIELAVQDSEWECLAGDETLTTLENMWFFVGEDGLGDTLKGYEDWMKANGKEKTHGVKGGVFEGALQDPAATNQILKLPSKKDLMARIAGGINMAGAQGIAIRLKKASGQKLARAIKLLVEEEKLSA